MLEIYLQLYSVLREKLPPDSKGKAVLHLNDGAVLADLLEELDITSRVVISVNEAHEPDLSRRLQNGDKVRIFSSVSGGAPATLAQVFIEKERKHGSWL